VVERSAVDRRVGGAIRQARDAARAVGMKFVSTQASAGERF
jgi:hypothetical protein